MNPRKAENIFSERKRDNRVNAWLGMVKTPLESENVALIGENAFAFASAERNRHSRRRKCNYRAKTSHNKAIAGLPSEDVGSKGENAFRERKRSSLR